MRSKKNQRIGFTLIELLIVVAIIGILAAIAIPNFLQAQVRAKVARVKSDQRTLSNALELYHVDHNYYPLDFYGAVQYTGNPPSVPPASWPVEYLIQLSTPIDYVSSLNSYLDPFNAKSTVPPYVRPGYLYYAGMDRCWGWAVRANAPDRLPAMVVCIKSFGPDQLDQGGEWILLGMDYSLSGFSNLDRIYDPTNGTISYGDVMRVTGQSRGISQVHGG